MFAWVVLARLHVLAECIYPESQCDFRSGRSKIDMLFSVRQLQQKCREQQQPLYLAFIDLTKAFDLVSRTGLFKLLEKIGCQTKRLSIIASFHVNRHDFVSFDGEISEPFKIGKAASWLPHILGFSSSWCLVMLLVQPQMASTCTPDIKMLCTAATMYHCQEQ